MSLTNPMGARMALLEMLARQRALDQQSVQAVNQPLQQAAGGIRSGVDQYADLQRLGIQKQDLAIRQAVEQRRKQAEFERQRDLASQDVLGRLTAEEMAAGAARPAVSNAGEPDTADILDGPSLDFNESGQEVWRAPQSAPQAQPSDSTQPTLSGMAADETGNAVQLGGQQIEARRQPVQAQQGASGFPEAMPQGLRAQQAPQFQPELPPAVIYDQAQRYKALMAERGFQVDDNMAMRAAQEHLDKLTAAYQANVKARTEAFDKARKDAKEDLQLNAQQALSLSNWEKTKQAIENNFPANVSAGFRRMSDAADLWASSGGIRPEDGQWRDTMQRRDYEVAEKIAKELGLDPNKEGDLATLREVIASRYNYYAQQAKTAGVGQPGSLIRDRLTKPIPATDATGKPIKEAPKIPRGAAAERMSLTTSHRNVREMAELTMMFDSLRESGLDTGAAQDFFRTKVAQKIGWDPDSGTGEFYQRMGQAFSDYVKSISGAAVSAAEFERLLRDFPNSAADQDALIQRLNTQTGIANRKFRDAYEHNKRNNIYQGGDDAIDALYALPENKLQANVLNRHARKRLESGRPVDVTVYDIKTGRMERVTVSDPAELEVYAGLVDSGEAFYHDVFGD